LISGSAGNKDRKDAFVFECEFRADQGAGAMFFGGRMQAGRAVKSIAIAQRECRKTEPGGGANEILRIRCATEEAEGAAGVEFDVGHRNEEDHFEQKDAKGAKEGRSPFFEKFFASFAAFCEIRFVTFNFSPFIAAFDFPDGLPA
jgi:hypothetical protein